MKWNRKRSKFRSGFEDKVAKDLTERNIPYEFETVRLQYTKLSCPHCGGIADTGTYTPDFIFQRASRVRLILECKGYFDSTDRNKLQRVKRDNPKEDIRLLFQRDQPIRKGSKTLYSGWAIKNGFPWATGTSVPDEWLKGTK